LTVAELKVMLARAEKEIEIKAKRIAVLETIVMSLGGNVPHQEVLDVPDIIKLEEEMEADKKSESEESELEVSKDEEKEDEEKEEEEEEKYEQENNVEDKYEQDNYEKARDFEVQKEESATISTKQTSSETPLSNRSEVNTIQDEEDADEKIREEILKITTEKQKEIEILSEQLSNEKQSSKLTKEKLIILRREYNTKVNKLADMTKENDNMLSKMAKLTIQVQELLQGATERDIKIEELDKKNRNVNEEVSKLREAYEEARKNVVEKEEEIQRLKGMSVPSEMVIKGKVVSEDTIKLQEAVKNFQHLYSKFSKIKEIKDLDPRVVKIMKDEIPSYVSPPSMQSSGVPSTDIMSILQQELEQTKKLNKEMQDKLAKSFDKKATSDLINKAVEEALQKQTTKFEGEKQLILKDLQNRVDKVVKLEMDLDESKEKYKGLEASMSEGDKSMRRKVNSLERNLEQLTLMYHQLASQKSLLKVDNQVFERKVQRKNEKITELEKQLAKAKEQLNMFKAQAEALKNALIKNTIPGSEGMVLSEEQQNFLLQRPYLGVTSSVALPQHSSKIRKPIKGGRRMQNLRGTSMMGMGMLAQSFENLKKDDPEKTSETSRL